jgi:hypothetical protein
VCDVPSKCYLYVNVVEYFGELFCCVFEICRCNQRLTLGIFFVVLFSLYSDIIVQFVFVLNRLFGTGFVVICILLYFFLYFYCFGSWGMESVYYVANMIFCVIYLLRLLLLVYGVCCLIL